ncbi:MAG: hypothetical protein JW732_02630 [Dehalococcoidia bacterium]|nr:hypothetical protein [Dehalococcoidia bacterium]
MNVYCTAPGYKRLASTPKLSKQARQSSKCFDYYSSHGHNESFTCYHFDISPQTFYCWKERHNPRHLESLENRSHRLWHVRQPTYSAELANAGLRLREEYPDGAKINW